MVATVVAMVEAEREILDHNGVLVEVDPDHRCLLVEDLAVLLAVGISVDLHHRMLLEEEAQHVEGFHHLVDVHLPEVLHEAVAVAVTVVVVVVQGVVLVLLLGRTRHIRHHHHGPLDLPGHIQPQEVGVEVKVKVEVLLGNVK